MKVLYIDIDTLRPDHLGCYGYSRNTSPNIDEVAKEGVLFTDYYCSDAPCLPSRAALFSGQFGIHNNVVSHGGTTAEMRQEGARRGMGEFNGRYSLPAVMRRKGMRTVSISSFPERHGAWWFNGGFDETINIGKRGQESAEEVIPYALDWLNRNEDRENWFMHVHMWDPHMPYRVPEEFGHPFEHIPLSDGWMTEEILENQRKYCVGAHSAMEVNGYTNTLDPDHPRQLSEVKTLDDFRRLINEYDTGVWYADRAVGILVDQLKKQGIYEDTAIIISSDHGESLGEKGSYCEHGEADAIVTHIPMIIRWPGCAKNKVSHGFHYNVDLIPTLIDLMGGIPPFTCHPVAGKPNPIRYDGESYGDLVRSGEDGGREFLVVSQCAHVCQRSVLFGDWIYTRTYHDGYHLLEEDELFNLKEDPHEIHNVAKEHEAVCWHGAWYLEHWVAENMLNNIYDSHVDPLWTTIAEGGPFHCRGYLSDYCKRLKETGRGEAAEELCRRHPAELG